MRRRNLSHALLRATTLITLAACGAPADQTCTALGPTGILPATLREASGAALDAEGRLWIIADSGEPVVYTVDDQDRIAPNPIDVRRVDDWEALAIGNCPDGQCLLIGAIGDNLHRRPQRAVLRIPLPIADGSASPERFRFSYPDQPSDAEALVALADGSLLVITKGRNGPVGVYRYPHPLRADTIITLDHVQNLTDGIVQVPFQPTGAASHDGIDVLLRTYSSVQRYRWNGDSLQVVGAPIDLSRFGEPQGEAIAVDGSGLVILVGESAGGGTVVRLRCELGE
jgi:hypothetical protein